MNSGAILADRLDRYTNKILCNKNWSNNDSDYFGTFMAISTSAAETSQTDGLNEEL